MFQVYFTADPPFLMPPRASNQFNMEKCLSTIASTNDITICKGANLVRLNLPLLGLCTNFIINITINSLKVKKNLTIYEKILNKF